MNVGSGGGAAAAPAAGAAAAPAAGAAAPAGGAAEEAPKEEEKEEGEFSLLFMGLRCLGGVLMCWYFREGGVGRRHGVRPFRLGLLLCCGERGGKWQHRLGGFLDGAQGLLCYGCGHPEMLAGISDRSQCNLISS